MQFKSVRCWSKRCARFLALSGALAGVAPLGAYAALEVVPESPYKLTYDSKADETNPSAIRTVWYASLDPAAKGQEYQIDKGFKNLDLTETATSAGADPAHLIRFTVNSNSALPFGNAILAVFAASGSTWVPVPIASPAGTCTITNAGCIKYNPDELANDDLLFATRFTSGMLIGIYPKDLCYAAAQQGLTANGCTGANVSTTPGAAKVSLLFAVFPAPAETEKFDTGTLDKITNEVWVRVRVGLARRPPGLGCPTPLVDSYFPGDSAITLYPSVFRPIAGEAPVTHLYAIGRQGGADPDRSRFDNPSAHDVWSNSLDVSDTPQLSGFENTEGPGDLDKPYVLLFAAKDAAGVISDELGTGQLCRLTDVRTAEIPGFLSESQCFIATAAFSSGDVEPVRLLRKFRDQVLLRTGLGRSFVEWYYSWSPRAAMWLLENPEFKTPLLRALIPVQSLAWLFLHPLVALIWGAVSIGSIGLAWRRTSE